MSKRDGIDYAIYVLFALMGGILVAAGIYLVFYFGNHDKFNRWIDDCNAAGGQISLTQLGEFSDRYECFINGKITHLSSWK